MLTRSKIVKTTTAKRPMSDKQGGLLRLLERLTSLSNKVTSTDEARHKTVMALLAARCEAFISELEYKYMKEDVERLSMAKGASSDELAQGKALVACAEKMVWDTIQREQSLDKIVADGQPSEFQDAFEALKKDRAVKISLGLIH